MDGNSMNKVDCKIKTPTFYENPACFLSNITETLSAKYTNSLLRFCAVLLKMKK
jgi:hypothetical protein